MQALNENLDIPSAARAVGVNLLKRDGRMVKLEYKHPLIFSHSIMTTEHSPRLEKVCSAYVLLYKGGLKCLCALYDHKDRITLRIHGQTVLRTIDM